MALPVVAIGIVLQDEPGTLTVFAAGVKLSFVGVEVTILNPPELTDDEVLRVASSIGLGAHKLKVILQRAKAKDYYDIAAALVTVFR